MKHLEIRSFEHEGIKVTVKIDYDARQISLVERDSDKFKCKKWHFAGREIQYTKSWHRIFSAMSHAVKEGEKLLQVHIDKVTNNQLKSVMDLQEGLNSKE